MGATIWKGAIRFNGIDVPVKLHTAVSEERIQFHLLHRSDKARLRQQMICALEKEPVPPEEQARGFEVEEGKYLIVEPGEIDSLTPESSRVIEVQEFVKSSRIDPFYLDHVYYLEPDSANVLSKRYGLVVKALQDLGAVGICTWSMRKRSHFGALQATGTTLRLWTLRYADEILPAASLGLKEAVLSEKELSIGSELIAKMSGPFVPAKYADEHEKKLRDLIERKARGEKIEIRPPRERQATQEDKLLEALEASLKKAA
ncbi:MAG: Ku protein [Nitrospiraceae bacterium]|nr:Ku protein [Nitrospiraceae bacterium]